MIIDKEQQERWGKLTILSVCLVVLLLVPLKVASFGFMPPDDALRHVAHVIDGRNWSEVLVMSPDIPADMDSHPGWHSILRFLHRNAGLTPDELVACSYFITFVVFMWAGVFASGAALPWLGTCIVLLIVQQDFYFRLLLGRPFVITSAALVIFLFQWVKGPIVSIWRELVIGALILGVSNWVHPSAWYVWSVVVFALVLGGEVKRAVVFCGSLVLGLLIASAWVGSFHQIVVYPIVHLWHALFDDPIYSTNLVSEFQPSGAPGLVCFIAAGVLAVKVYHQKGQGLVKEITRIDFLIFVIMWVLGLKVLRFWVDWGIPAFAVWITGQFIELGKFRLIRFKELIAIGSLTVVGLYLGVTANAGGRYTMMLKSSVLTQPVSEFEHAMPADGGILYSTEMVHFYQFYFRFPHARFKYVLGFEPGMMAPDDLKIYRSLQTTRVFDSFKPWFEKMNPKDRIIMTSAEHPSFPGMKFERFYGGWMGWKVAASSAAPLKPVGDGKDGSNPAAENPRL